jgi:hypothetical protein
LVIVNVNDELWPTLTLAGLNDEAMLGGKGALTMRVAVAVLPTPSFDVTVTELTFVPAVTPTTLIPMLQDTGEGMVAPESVTVPLPATAVTVPEGQLDVKLFGVATARPAGKVSVNATPVLGTPPPGNWRE